MIALSWSRISDYRQCPHKFDLKYIQKAPNFQMKDADKNPHLVRGGNVHKQLENYVVKKLQGLPVEVTMPEVISTIPLIDQIMRNYTVHPEKQVAINEKFELVDWYARDAWFRVIIDLIGWGNDLLLGDYKTGKFTDYSGSKKELGQLHMSSLIGMAIWPEYENGSSVYIYVDHKKTIPCKTNRMQDFEDMKEKLCEEHASINSDKSFIERKNRFCGYCDATREQCVNSKK